MGEESDKREATAGEGPTAPAAKGIAVETDYMNIDSRPPSKGSIELLPWVCCKEYQAAICNSPGSIDVTITQKRGGGVVLARDDKRSSISMEIS